MRTLSSPLKEIMVTVCFTSIPPLGARLVRSLRGGVTSRMADESTQSVAGGECDCEASAALVSRMSVVVNLACVNLGEGRDRLMCRNG